MTLHKIFKEMLKLDQQDRSLIWDALHEAENCKRTCQDLGIKFTDKKLAKFVYERIKRNSCGVQPIGIPAPTTTFKQIEQVICGTNLDKIEEAAEKKGLL